MAGWAWTAGGSSPGLTQEPPRHRTVLSRLTNLFWLWTILGVAWAWVAPAHFTWFKPHIAAGLGIIMLGMGITLSLADFRAVLRLPLAVGLGVLLQFLVMPLLARNSHNERA